MSACGERCLDPLWVESRQNFADEGRFWPPPRRVFLRMTRDSFMTADGWSGEMTNTFGKLAL
jgi:hypothetical protein